MAYADHAPPGGVMAALAASITAGPIFIASYLLAMAIAGAGGAPDAIASEAVALALGLLAIAVPFGIALAFVPCLVVAMLMAPLARRPGVGRLAPVWVIAGAAPIAPFAIYSGSGAPETFAFAATGALCALVARRTLLRQFAAER